MRGIDVSKHNNKGNPIDWGKVNASGIDFALIRAGFGNDISQKDPKFDENVQGALANKLHVGAYWFSYAVSVADALKEAEVFKKILAPYKGKIDFPVAFDYEYDSIAYAQKKGISPTNALIDSMARAFMDSMKADGWFVNLYTNNDFIKSRHFTADTRSKYDVWLADYSGAPDYPCGIQQTGSTGTVPGIEGNVDMDTAYKDYPTILRASGCNGFPKPQIVDFKSDTTTDIRLALGQFYQMKVTAQKVPTVTIGTQGVAVILPRYREGNDSYFYFVGIGKAGASAGVYINGVKQFKIYAA